MGKLTAETLRRLIHYNPDTGVFTWKVDRGRKAKAGDVAGFVDELGYRKIKIGGVRYQSCRLAWMYVHGVGPRHEIDHINRIKSDDRICNLREATRRQNVFNRVFGPSHGVKKLKNGNFCSRISFDGKEIHIGVFSSFNEAMAARMEYSRRLFGAYSPDAAS